MKNTLLVGLLPPETYLPARAQNPIICDVFTANVAPLVYRDMRFLYTGRDTVSVQETNYINIMWVSEVTGPGAAFGEPRKRVTYLGKALTIKQ